MATDTTDDITPELPKLTRRRQRLADEYLTGVTGAQAARNIGMEGTNLQLTDRAYKILHRPEVKAYLAEKRRDLEAATGIRQERALRRLNSICETHIGLFYDENGNFKRIHELPEELAGAIESVEYEQRTVGEGDKAQVVTSITKIKLHSPIRANEAMGRQLGWNKDVLELKNALTLPAPIINIAPYEDDPAADHVPRQPAAT